jgi:hypothetical protein
MYSPVLLMAYGAFSWQVRSSFHLESFMDSGFGFNKETS